MKMHHHKKLLLFILQATLLSIPPPCFPSQSTITYPVLNPTTCDGESFQCGSIRYISYPFWGGDRPLECGRPDSELVCNGNVPMLNISPLSYRVQLIDFNNNTLTVAREDLWNNTCPKALHNTTIDSDFFGYSPESNDQNVTLFFDCTSSDQGTLPNRFSCGGDDSNTTNLFKIGYSSSGPGFGITCRKNIFVPINAKAAESLKDPTDSSINILQAALATGFSIKWREDEYQRLSPYCNSKIYTCRFCSYNNSCSRSGGGDSPAPAYAIAPVSAPDGSYYQAQSPAPTHATAPLSAPDSAYYQVQSPAPTHATAPLSGSYGQPRYDSGNSSPPAKTILGVILGIIGVVVVSITIYCSLKRRRLLRGRNNGSNQDVEDILLQHGLQVPKRYKYSQIKKITESFNDKLGQGGFGSVYKGILPDGCLVAVKVLIEAGSNGEEFINEVASISRTSHVNIVNLLGFCYDRSRKALVYEFMPNKSLDKFISSNAHHRLDTGKLYKIALGVAKGLEYLHTGCNTRIVHFDIKPQNILLDEDFCPKISDFGLAKLCKKKQSILSMLGARGTIGYIAPEIFSRNFGAVSHKSDVYSYGMMVLEMAGARNIVETETMQSSENYFPDKIYEEVLLDVTRKLDDFNIEEEDDATRKMLLVGFWCIQTTPSDRPSMPKVVEMLEGRLQSIQIPPKPFLFCPKLTGQELSLSSSKYAETEIQLEVR